jgi:PAS domain S-box-containing protein
VIREISEDIFSYLTELISGGLIMDNGKILVVEDERITAKDIKRSLEKAGYNVPETVSTGEDAIKLSEKYKPDLVLMDIKLEGEVDGIDAAETITSKFAIPVIYLTSYSDKSTVERAKTTHPSAFILKEPFGFLHKPFEENELYTAIDIILKRNNDKDRLKSQDKLLASILKTISDGVIAIDSEERIKFMNSTAEKITGWTENNSLGKKLFNVMRVFDLKTDLLEEVNLDEIGDGELRIKSNNVKTPIEGTITPLKDENGLDNGMIFIFRSMRD